MPGSLLVTSCTLRFSHLVDFVVNVIDTVDTSVVFTLHKRTDKVY